ncbi:MAG: hypothetical protein A3K10_07790 [Bacteroidetes bacterium RIFCSPLOWO2_12_FULL_31_6]|nr:MAG: hypothetical protein A3K10_07790 [Bacteroidetes bacterium RIFCSPLOWO2_12_FULL_31_6]
MVLAVVKTAQNKASVEDFINAVPDEQKREDSFTILKMMKQASKEEPRMWGASLIGFGKVIIKSAASGREVEWFLVGFSPRKANFSLYLSLNIPANLALLKKLGKHKTGVGCLYFNKLSDVDIKVLKEMIVNTLKKK